MKPKKFKEYNTELTKPRGTTKEQCQSLFVHRDGVQCISLWKLSFRDHLRILWTGKIWLGVLSGRTQYPVWLDTNKPEFNQDDTK